MNDSEFHKGMKVVWRPKEEEDPFRIIRDLTAQYGEGIMVIVDIFPSKQTEVLLATLSKQGGVTRTLHDELGDDLAVPVSFLRPA